MSDENTPADEGRPDPIDAIGDPVELANEGNDGFLGTPWSRRTFLKAAALGTAAAAVFQKGPGWTLNPAAAWANDLSTNPCTAGDVTILGGTIINEPCTCASGGTFNAVAQFTVRNSTSTGRYCIVLHLVASGGVAAQDVILRDSSGNSTAPGKSGGASFQDTVMTGTIVGVPCGASQICFGQALASDFKGKCAAGTCSTVAWSTTPGDAGCTTADQKPPGGQCRHQQICVQGFGITATCADSSCTARDLSDCGNSVTGCSVTCGSTLYVKIAASGQSGATCNTALTLSVKRPGETSFTNFTPNSAGCYTDSSPVAGTYTFRATDCHSCFRETTLVVCVAQPTVSLISDATGTCDASGDVTFTADSGFDNYDFFVDDTAGSGTAAQSGSGNTYAYPVDADNTCHTVTVIATKDTTCTATATSHITQCVTSTVATGDCPA